MKKAFSILVMVFLNTNCTFKKKPEFLGIEKIDLEHVRLDIFTIRADALFKNENDLGGTLYTDDIEVFIDSTHIATVSSEAFDVPFRDVFTIPLKVEFSASKLFNEGKKGLLGTIINQVLNKKVEVNFKGEITYGYAGFSYDYPIDHTEEIQIE